MIGQETNFCSEYNMTYIFWVFPRLILHLNIVTYGKPHFLFAIENITSTLSYVCSWSFDSHFLCNLFVCIFCAEKNPTSVKLNLAVHNSAMSFKPTACLLKFF